MYPGQSSVAVGPPGGAVSITQESAGAAPHPARLDEWMNSAEETGCRTWTAVGAGARFNTPPPPERSKLMQPGRTGGVKEEEEDRKVSCLRVIR